MERFAVAVAILALFFAPACITSGGSGDDYFDTGIHNYEDTTQEDTWFPEDVFLWDDTEKPEDNGVPTEDIEQPEDNFVPEDLPPVEDMVADTGGQDEVSFWVEVPQDWGRGPIHLFVNVEGLEGEVGDAILEVSLDGGDFFYPSELAGFEVDLEEMMNGEYVFVWDSFADAQEDFMEVVVRLSLDPFGEPFYAADFMLLNDPFMDRAMLVTSSINGNDKVRKLFFYHGDGLGGYDEGDTESLSPSPVDAAFSPNGRAAVTVHQGDLELVFWSVDPYDIPMVTTTVDAEGKYIDKAVFSQDGSQLFVVVSNSTADAGVYALDLDPTTSQPLPGGKMHFLSYHYVAGDIALLPNNWGYAVIASSKQDPKGALVLQTWTIDGQQAGELFFAPDGSTAVGVAVSPDGGVAAVYSNFFGDGDKAVFAQMSNGGDLQMLGEVELNDPDDVEFAGADSQHVIVSEAYGNKVTLLDTLGHTGLQKLQSVSLGLATSIASPVYGPDSDYFMVASVSAGTGQSGIGLVWFDGDSISLEETFSFGNGNDVIPSAVAIQP